VNTADWLSLSLILNAVLVFAHWRAFKMLGFMYKALFTADRMLKAVAEGDVTLKPNGEGGFRVTNLRKDHGN
jgi:uncharacterized protein (DUF58 family)